MLPRSPLQECDRSHRFKNVTAVTASGMLPQSPLHECYRGRRFKNVTAVTAARTLPLSPLLDVTAVTASRMFPRSFFQERYRHRSHLLRMLLQSPQSRSLQCYTAAAASRILPLSLSPLQEYYRGRRYKISSRTCLLRFSYVCTRVSWPKSSFQHSHVFHPLA